MTPSPPPSPPNGSPTSTPKPPPTTSKRSADPGPRPTSAAGSAPTSPATRPSNPATHQPGSPPWSPTYADTAPPTTNCSPPAWPRPPAPAQPIDTFRDRLILPIHHHGAHGVHVAGFVGRRHPDTDHLQPGTDAAGKAGPKYLNTGDTVLYAKGGQLYGIAEYPTRLAAGATPILVEGPIDVLAICLASPDHVGVAPLGTSLTDTQADSLTPHLTSPRGVLVATDGDLAAERDYWMLTARGGDPGHVTFPTGQDHRYADGRAALSEVQGIYLITDSDLRK